MKREFKVGDKVYYPSEQAKIYTYSHYCIAL